MADYLIQESTLDAIADAINAKTGGSSAMTPAEMVTAIGNLPSGGDPQVRNWRVLVGTVTQASKATTISFNTGIISGRIVSFVSYLADGIESLPEFTEDVPSQITGSSFRTGTSALPASTEAQMSLIRTSGGSNSNFITGSVCTLSSNGMLSFGNTRGSYSLPGTTYKYVAVIEVSS